MKRVPNKKEGKDNMVPSDLNQQFVWVSFYEAFATALLKYRWRREELLDAIIALQNDKSSKLPLSFLYDKEDNVIVPLNDICPFTVLATFNRGISLKNKIKIATALARILNVSEPVPDSFKGTPEFLNKKSMLYGFKDKRGEKDIDNLWEVFDCAIKYTDQRSDETKREFIKAFDVATSCFNVKWNLTIGLYWMRPRDFLPLDEKSRIYIETHLNEKIGKKKETGCIGAEEYLSLCDRFKKNFESNNYPVHSFPEVSWKAWQQDGAKVKGKKELRAENRDALPDEVVGSKLLSEYAVQNIIDDGCFLPLDKLNKILERLVQKKNLILQGPPGTGKTWLAKRLAYALIGQEATDRVRAVQFHPNLSYEDFVRGWRPNEGGTLALTDGPFMEMVEAAKRNKGDFVLIIEEINRGNPAQIFGEVLTLIERDKRSPEYSLELSYRREKNERVYIPDNLYVIGTMNVADRSLAQMDLALRRRFAFIDLKPELGDAWREFLIRNFGFPKPIVDKIQKRIVDLNDQISKDPRLGTQFCVGHSFVTPSSEIEDAQEWFKQVVETEIGPLLCHYWFDDLDKAQNAKEALLKDL